MALSNRYLLNVCFPTENMDEWERKNKLIHDAVGYPDAAGTDIQTGERDMSWYDLSLEEALELRRQVLELKIEGLTASNPGDT